MKSTGKRLSDLFTFFLNQMAARGQDDMDSPKPAKRMMGTMDDMPESKLGGRHRIQTTGDHPVDDHLPNFEHSQPNPGIKLMIDA